MKILTFRLHPKTKKEYDYKSIEVNRFEKIGTTGKGLALKYTRAKTIFLYGLYHFDDMKLIAENHQINYDNIIQKYRFISDETFENIYDYAKKNEILYNYYDGQFTDIR